MDRIIEIGLRGIINYSQILDYLQNSVMNSVLTIISISTTVAHERHLQSGTISKHCEENHYYNKLFTKFEFICSNKISFLFYSVGNGVVVEENDHQEVL